MLWNDEPPYAARIIARDVVHWAPKSRSLVRELYGSATSLSLLNPKLAPHGNSPECFVVLKPPVTSSWVVGVAPSRTVPMSRRSRMANWGEIGIYALRFFAACAASSS